MDSFFDDIMAGLAEKDIETSADTDERIERITDTLMDFFADDLYIDSTSYDFAIYVDTDTELYLDIVVLCPEIVVRTKRDREFYKVIEEADRFTFSDQGDKEDGIMLVLTVKL